jgi:hypothetical protein
MECPKCKKETDYALYETVDDYQDGTVECLNCGEEIATFFLGVIRTPSISELLKKEGVETIGGTFYSK